MLCVGTVLYTKGLVDSNKPLVPPKNVIAGVGVASVSLTPDICTCVPRHVLLFFPPHPHTLSLCAMIIILLSFLFQLSKQMGGVVKGLDKVMQSMDLEKVQ